METKINVSLQKIAGELKNNYDSQKLMLVDRNYHLCHVVPRNREKQGLR